MEYIKHLLRIDLAKADNYASFIFAKKVKMVRFWINFARSVVGVEYII